MTRSRPKGSRFCRGIEGSPSGRFLLQRVSPPHSTGIFAHGGIEGISGDRFLLQRVSRECRRGVQVHRDIGGSPDGR